MQNLSIQIQDSYMQKFMNFVKESHSNIVVSKDKNLEIDPYFYERKRDLEQIIKEAADRRLKMQQDMHDRKFGRGGIPELKRPI